MNDIQVWCEVVCQRCGTTLEGVYFRNGAISKLRENARKFGWTVINDETMCPRCKELHRNTEDNNGTCN